MEMSVMTSLRAAPARLGGLQWVMLLAALVALCTSAGWPALSQAQGAGVILDLVPSSSCVNANQTFTVQVRITAGAQTLDDVDAYLNFDPTNLQVTQVNPGGIFST